MLRQAYRSVATALLLVLLGAAVASGAPAAQRAPKVQRTSAVPGVPQGGPVSRWKTQPAPGLSASAAILMDWRTGEVLYDRAADQRRAPASTTKILTALIAVERGNMEEKVTISKRAALTGGSRMHISAGEVYSLYDLLHGLLLRSGNDAAVAIAEHIAGSVEAFAGLMNEKARALGATNSHFVNPHGLTEPDHYSTARDLAIITRQALENELLARIVSQRESSLTYEQLHRSVILHNTNRLLSILEGADGVKTGTTAAAGRCLIASATRDEHKLVAVVLHAPNRWYDAARLLEWGFGNFRLAYVGRQGERLIAAPVRGGKSRVVPLALSADLPVLLPRQEPPEASVKIRLTRRPAAPVRPGVKAGQVQVEVEGRVVAEAALLTDAAVPEATLVDHLYRAMEPILERVAPWHILSAIHAKF